MKPRRVRSAYRAKRAAYPAERSAYRVKRFAYRDKRSAYRAERFACQTECFALLVIATAWTLPLGCGRDPVSDVPPSQAATEAPKPPPSATPSLSAIRAAVDAGRSEDAVSKARAFLLQFTAQGAG